VKVVRVLGEKWEKVEGGKNPVQAFGSLASISWHSLPPDSIPSEATKTGNKTPQKQLQLLGEFNMFVDVSMLTRISICRMTVNSLKTRHLKTSNLKCLVNNWGKS